MSGVLKICKTRRSKTKQFNLRTKCFDYTLLTAIVQKIKIYENGAERTDDTRLHDKYEKPRVSEN